MTGRGRRALAAAAVVGLVAAAAVLAVLAVDVVRVDRQLTAADVRYVAGAGDDPSWVAKTLLPSGVATHIVGVDDDVRYRRAAERFWASEPRAELREFADVTKRARAERGLAELADSDESAQRRSALATMRGALLLEEARNSPTQREVFVRRAIEQFRRAVQLDPTNHDAAFDLELSLKLHRRSGTGDQSGGDARSPLPSPGAGAATSGGGF